jgi:hypothetical protein
MTHPLFRKDIFVETAFERRFQAMLRSAWRKRSWHVIVADPGAGKTMGIRDLIKAAGSRAILAVVAPKNGSVLDVEMTMLDKQSKGVPIDEQANDDVVHLDRFREADRLTDQAFDPCS